jgi:hypothetical protein
MKNINKDLEFKLMMGNNKDNLKLFKIYKKEIENKIRGEIFDLNFMIDKLEKIIKKESRLKC